MPIVRIDIQEGKSTAYRRELLHGVRRAITSSLSVADERVMQRIIEVPADDIDSGARRTDSFTVIEIAMMAGRGTELKRALYEEIIRELKVSPGILERDIVVHIVDPPADCFCIGGESAAFPAGEGARMVEPD